MLDPHDALRSIGSRAADLVSAIPADPNRRSPSWLERKELREAPRLGRIRAELVDLLETDTRLMTAYSILLLSGVADCVEIAATRNNELNIPTLSAAVRPLVETCGQIAWLLDGTIDAEERVRRYLIWRFSDLRAQRLIVSAAVRDLSEAADAMAELDATEAELLELVDRAGWRAAATVTRAGGDVIAAALLDSDERRLPMPKPGALAMLVTSEPLAYALLSAPTHGARWGVVHSARLEATEGSDVGRPLKMTGMGMDPNLAIVLAVGAINQTGTYLGARHLVDDGPLRRDIQALVKRL